MESEEAKKELEKGKQVQRRKVRAMGHFAETVCVRQTTAWNCELSKLSSGNTNYLPNHISHITVSRAHKNGRLE